MLYLYNVLIWIFTVVLFNSIRIFAVIQRDVRTDSTGTCSTGLLKSLPNSSFSASSVLKNEPEFRPQSVVMDTFYELTPSRMAWCPDKPVSSNPTEWLQIEFNSTKIIKNIFTVGRDDGNYGEYVPNYFFDYQREDAMTWYRYRDGDNVQKIKGNNDARNPAHKTFETPLVAKRIRIIPINVKQSSVCLRMILYGCDFNDGVVEYRIPRGDNFDDNRYDGSEFSNDTWLQGGMGKLMDNVIPFNSSNQHDTQRSVVAWDKSQHKSDHVELLFRFDAVRTFHTVQIYVAVLPSLMMLPFSSIVIELSETETMLPQKTTTVKVSPAHVDIDQPVNITLDDKVAKFIRMSLFFQSRWMGLYEVVFDSEPVRKGIFPVQPIKPPVNVSPALTSYHPSTDSTPKLIIHITLIACLIGAFLLAAVLTIICFLWVRQRNRRRYKSKLCEYRTMLMNDTSYPSNMGNINTISGTNPVLYGPVESHMFDPNSSGTIGFRYIHPLYPPSQEYRPHSSNNSNEYEPVDSYWPKAPQQQNKIIIKDNNTLDQYDRQTLLGQVAPDITHNTSLSNISGCVPVYGSGSAYSSHPYDASLAAPDIIPLTVVTHSTFADIFNTHICNPLKGLMGSSMSCCHLTPTSPSWIDSALSRLTEIRTANIIYEKHVSEGEFGRISSGFIEDFHIGVILVTLKRNAANVDVQYGFYRQCLLTIKEDFSSHPNLLPIVGRSNRDNICSSILYSYPSQVNVVTFFHKLRQIPRSTDVSFSCSYVSQGSLLYLSKQLADALAFLDEAAVVHRDVAARNCSIGDRFHLILSDFAIGLEEFHDDYTLFSPPLYHSIKDGIPLSRTVQLPLLWMPWEAVMMGNFSSMSDVWSFGVAMWEIFTECQLKPYSTSLPVTNHDPGVIIKNAMLIANNHPSSILPNGRCIEPSINLSNDNKGSSSTSTTTTDISRRLRDIMNCCWNSNPVLRPNFQTLYSVLCELSPDTRYIDEYGTLHRLIG